MNKEFDALDEEEKQTYLERYLKIFRGNIIYACNGDILIDSSIHSYKNAEQLKHWKQGLIHHYKENTEGYNILRNSFGDSVDKGKKAEIIKKFGNLPLYDKSEGEAVYQVAVKMVNGTYDYSTIISGEITPENLHLFTAEQEMIESQFNINGKEDSDFHELFKN